MIQVQGSASFWVLGAREDNLILLYRLPDWSMRGNHDSFWATGYHGNLQKYALLPGGSWTSLPIMARDPKDTQSVSQVAVATRRAVFPERCSGVRDPSSASCG